MISPIRSERGSAGSAGSRDRTRRCAGSAPRGGAAARWERPAGRGARRRARGAAATAPRPSRGAAASDARGACPRPARWARTRRGRPRTGRTSRCVASRRAWPIGRRSSGGPTGRPGARRRACERVSGACFLAAWRRPRPPRREEVRRRRAPRARVRRQRVRGERGVRNIAGASAEIADDRNRQRDRGLARSTRVLSTWYNTVYHGSRCALSRTDQGARRAAPGSHTPTMLVRLLALAALHASTALAPPDAKAVELQHGARSLQDETTPEQIPEDGLKLGGCHLALQVHVSPKGFEGHHEYEMHITVVSPWEEGTVIKVDVSASGGIRCHDCCCTGWGTHTARRSTRATISSRASWGRSRRRTCSRPRLAQDRLNIRTQCTRHQSRSQA